MQIITLTTDWGHKDHYLPAFKGELTSFCPDISIIDITHDIEHFNILEASYILKNCFEKFPKGTIHFIGLFATSYSAGNYLLVKFRNHFFIGVDSGIFSLIAGKEEIEIVRLSATKISSALNEESLLTVVADLTKGKDYVLLGEKTNELIEFFHTQPTVDQSGIRGTVIHIDSFENIIVNISRNLFEEVRNERPFVLNLKGQRNEVNRMHNKYGDADEGELVALFNGDGFLEIAINKGKASSLLNIKMFDPILVNFLG